MHLDDFDYTLPDHLIAQTPAQERTQSRLLHVGADHLSHLQFADIEQLLRPGDLLVMNDTRVIKARLFATKATGGKAELLVERVESEFEALCQVKVSKPVKDQGVLHCGAYTLTNRGRVGVFYRLTFSAPVMQVLEACGSVPLPPYIEREAQTVDEGRYQTVIADKPGAVAAPTAGLHFDEALLQRLAQQNVQLAKVTLHVGAGTFAPVRGALEDHQMHFERYEVPAATAAAIRKTQDEGGRVVAVGTTVVRTLESAAQHNYPLQACSDETNLFIKPGFKFQVVDALVTNFHLPRSTLMLLVCALGGYERVMHAYNVAVAEEYRFFSYGDAMFLNLAA